MQYYQTLSDSENRGEQTEEKQKTETDCCKKKRDYQTKYIQAKHFTYLFNKCNVQLPFAMIVERKKK